MIDAGRHHRPLAAALVALMLSGAWPVPAQPPAAGADPLLAGFRDPRAEARPRVWWHWMNGNVTKVGIARDLVWMKRVGIGGAQAFDAALETPQVVDKRLVYMTPEWKDAFRFAASEADRLGLELAIASSPGWSGTGGPWVPPEDGLKKLVWSETDVIGGRRFAGRTASPPDAVGPYQGLKSADGIGSLLGGKAPPLPAPLYRDIAVLAFPAPTGEAPLAATVTDGGGAAVDGARLTDADPDSAVELKPGGGGPPSLTVRYAGPRTVRSASLFLSGAASVFTGAGYAPRIEASDDGATWRTVAAAVPLSIVPTTVAFAPVTARASPPTSRASPRRAAGGPDDRCCSTWARRGRWRK